LYHYSLKNQELERWNAKEDQETDSVWSFVKYQHTWIQKYDRSPYLRSLAV